MELALKRDLQLYKIYCPSFARWRPHTKTPLLQRFWPIISLTRSPLLQTLEVSHSYGQHRYALGNFGMETSLGDRLLGHYTPVSPRPLYQVSHCHQGKSLQTHTPSNRPFAIILQLCTILLLYHLLI